MPRSQCTHCWNSCWCHNILCFVGSIIIDKSLGHFKWYSSWLQLKIVPGQYFYTPVLRRDVLWYGDVCLSVRISVCPSVSYMLWYIVLKFCIRLFFNEIYRSSSSVVVLRQVLKGYASFHTAVSDGMYYGMVMSVCLSGSPPSVRPGLHPSVHLSVTVFHTFLLHALTYYAEILHKTLF